MRQSSGSAEFFGSTGLIAALFGIPTPFPLKITGAIVCLVRFVLLSEISSPRAEEG